MVADRVAALARLRRSPRRERRIAVLLPDYPGAPGRAGYAVGLDVPASVLALLADLGEAGYAVRDVPPTSRALLDALDAGSTDATLSLDAYAALLASLPAEAVARIRAAWGEPAGDPDLRDGAFRFRARAFGNVLVALPPDRGRASDRRTDYHDPALPPRHALVAFGLWLRHMAKVDALVHMGAHGTLEWLPGKAVALTSSCFPEAVAGAAAGHLSVHRQQSGRGRASQAPHRGGDHRPPAAAARRRPACPARRASSSGWSTNTRRPTGSTAGGANAWRGCIVETAQRTGLAREAGVDADCGPDEALRRIDAWLCDLKDLAVKDGLHVYGRAPARMRRSVVAGERRSRARRPPRRARRPPRRAGPRRRAGARAPRRAADRPQSLHRRSAHPADADRRWTSAGSPPTR